MDSSLLGFGDGDGVGADVGLLLVGRGVVGLQSLQVSGQFWMNSVLLQR